MRVGDGIAIAEGDHVHIARNGFKCRRQAGQFARAGRQAVTAGDDFHPFRSEARLRLDRLPPGRVCF